MQQNAPITVLAGEDLPVARRIKISGASYVLAGVAENHDAITTEAIANGKYGSAVPRSYPGTVEIESTGAIAAGARVFAASSGRISATAAGGSIGRNAAEAGGGAGIYEILPFGDAEIFRTNVAATAGDDTNNYIDVDTGFGAAPTGPVIAQIRATTGIHRSPAGVITLNADGTIRVADANLAVNERLHLIAHR